MVDFIKYSVGEIPLDQVSNIAYKQADTLIINNKNIIPSEHHSIPELDLLS
jgi:hypothetical protein